MYSGASPPILAPRLTEAEVLAQGEIVPLEAVPDMEGDLVALFTRNTVRWVRWPDGVHAAVGLEATRGDVAAAYLRARDLHEKKFLETSLAFGEMHDERNKPWP